jgi:class 3 adenylate cyclase
MFRMGGVAIVMFSDLVDSTALLASLGDDRMELVRRTHVKDVTDAVDGSGGRVVKTLGDGVMASFESALGALHAAAQIQAAVERLDATYGEIGIAARVGVAAGEPIRDGDDLHGMPVVIASRLSSSAGTGEVLVQDLVQALIASRDGVRLDVASDFELKGVPTPVRASKLLWRELAQATTEVDPVVAEPGRDRGPLGAGSTVQDPGGGAPGGIRIPPVLAAYAEEPLIGRDREIAELRDATAPHDGRRAVLVLGEPGIGKTRHAAAAAAEAHADGAVVVLARCPPEPVVAFEPWVRAVGELALAGDDTWRASLAEAAGLELVALVPELSEHATLADRVAADDVVTAEGARYRLLRGICAALSFAAGDAPLHVVLDDAHWCDPASAQALGHLLESAPSQLVLVATARDQEMDRRHPVSRVLSELRRTGDLNELRLAGLDASGLAALVGARVGRAITPGLAARLQTRTSGNPFFAGELARDLEGRGALGEEEALEAAPVPEAVTDLVEERLGRLDTGTERLLAAVAAIGPAAPVGLAAKAAGLGPDEAERAVQEALSERLVDDVAAAEPTIAFPHALVREALIAGTGHAAAARLHLAIAKALEEHAGAEPGELARHYGLSVELAGPEPAIAAYRAAATVAAEAHDHEQAAAHIRSALSMLPEAVLAERVTALLELGEQELLCADLSRARRSFRAAVEAARATDDVVTLARAALGFAGGDIGFGWEVGTDDPASVELLREGLGALGDGEPRLALRMIFRLAYLLVFSDEDEEMAELARRAERLGRRLGDAEAEVLAGFTQMIVLFARSPDPLRFFDRFEDFFSFLDTAEECGREDLLFRVVQMSAFGHYVLGQIPDCDRAVERMGEIARRLGTPRFTWEVDLNRGQRLLDRGDREGGVALVESAGSIVRRLRPDIHIAVATLGLLTTEWIFDGETATSRSVYEAMERVQPRGLVSAFIAYAAAMEGDLETARRRMCALLDGDDLEPLRRPDGHLPTAIWALAFTATLVGDREAGARLRTLLEPLRPYVISPTPALVFGQVPEWHIGRLELLAGKPDAAVRELRVAIERADAYGIVWAGGMARADLATALHRCGDDDGSAAVLREAESMGERYGVGWVIRAAAEARTEIEGRELTVRVPAAERSRPIRALASRGGRHALSAMVGGLDDADLERRFADSRRQRRLLKTLARGFQPSQAGGFSGVIAYELEPFAIEPPPEAPWRWAIQVDSRSGRARLLEPAPLDAAVTIHIGLADWVRVIAGIEDALTVMVAGRCSVEGDVVLAMRLEDMFGGS